MAGIAPYCDNLRREGGEGGESVLALRGRAQREARRGAGSEGAARRLLFFSRRFGGSQARRSARPAIAEMALTAIVVASQMAPMPTQKGSGYMVMSSDSALNTQLPCAKNKL